MLFVVAFSSAERCTSQRTVWKPVNYLNLHILCLLKLHQQVKHVCFKWTLIGTDLTGAVNQDRYDTTSHDKLTDVSQQQSTQNWWACVTTIYMNL